MEINNEENQEWYHDKRFDFYWNSYNRMTNFPEETRSYLETHFNLLNASKKANAEAHKAASLALSKISQEHELGVVMPNVKKSKKPKKEKRNNENVELEFEISDDLVKFYEESIRFKLEKKELEKKKLSDENFVDYVSGEQINLNVNKSSKSAPLEHATLKREDELRALYGDRANAIHLAETNLQMKFDKNFDLYQPKYWPSFPLKLKFS